MFLFIPNSQFLAVVWELPCLIDVNVADAHNAFFGLVIKRHVLAADLYS